MKDTMPRKIRNSINAPMPISSYAHAVEVPISPEKSMLYLCGMGPRDKKTNSIPGIKKDQAGNILDYDFEAQARNVFENIATVVKDAGGKGLWNIIDVQVFLVDIKRDFAKFNELWKEYMVFDDGWMPTRTTVEVSALPLPEIFVELKCTALITK